jgi:hypothetical protein
MAFERWYFSAKTVIFGAVSGAGIVPFGSSSACHNQGGVLVSTVQKLVRSDTYN